MPTLSDVAQVCGVSPMTVSCVLNNKRGRVSAATRERVLRAVRELNYHPNAMARGLTGQSLNTLGVVYLHSHSPVHTAESFVMMLDGVLDTATKLRQDTLMCTSYSWEDGLEGVSRLLDRRCDGLIIVVPTLDLPLLPVLKENGIPFVLLCGKSTDPDISSVDTDNVDAVRDLIGKVLDKGHRRIAVIHNGPETQYLYCRDRLAGYQLALQERDLPYDPRLIWPVRSVREAVDALLVHPHSWSARTRPTALFGVSDNIALSLLVELRARGCRVPEDFSIVGFDDIPRAATTEPGLTTVRQPLKQIGQKCVELLLSQISGTEPGPQKVILPTEYIERGTLTAPGSFGTDQEVLAQRSHPSHLATTKEANP